MAYLVSEPDRGIYNAMNKGIKAATGDVLFFLNADDRFADERVVADVAPVFEQRPDLEIVYGNLSWQLADRILKHKHPPMITKEYLTSRTVLHQTVFAQRQAFAAINGFSERLCGRARCDSFEQIIEAKRERHRPGRQGDSKVGMKLCA